MKFFKKIIYLMLMFSIETSIAYADPIFKVKANIDKDLRVYLVAFSDIAIQGFDATKECGITWKKENDKQFISSDSFPLEADIFPGDMSEVPRDEPQLISNILNGNSSCGVKTLDIDFNFDQFLTQRAIYLPGGYVFVFSSPVGNSFYKKLGAMDNNCGSESKCTIKRINEQGWGLKYKKNIVILKIDIEEGFDPKNINVKFINKTKTKTITTTMKLQAIECSINIDSNYPLISGAKLSKIPIKDGNVSRECLDDIIYSVDLESIAIKKKNDADINLNAKIKSDANNNYYMDILDQIPTDKFKGRVDFLIYKNNSKNKIANLNVYIAEKPKVIETAIHYKDTNLDKLWKSIIQNISKAAISSDCGAGCYPYIYNTINVIFDDKLKQKQINSINTILSKILQDPINIQSSNTIIDFIVQSQTNAEILHDIIIKDSNELLYISELTMKIAESSFEKITPMPILKTTSIICKESFYKFKKMQKDSFPVNIGNNKAESISNDTISSNGCQLVITKDAAFTNFGAQSINVKILLEGEKEPIFNNNGKPLTADPNNNTLINPNNIFELSFAVDEKLLDPSKKIIIEVSSTEDSKNNLDYSSYKFTAFIRPKGQFVFFAPRPADKALSTITNNSKIACNIPLSILSLRTPAAASDLSNSTNYPAVQPLDFQSGLLCGVEPWSYKSNYNPTYVKFRAGLLNQGTKFNPSLVAGFQGTLPIIKDDGKLSTSFAIGGFLEKDLRTQTEQIGENTHLLFTIGFNFLSQTTKATN